MTVIQRVVKPTTCKGKRVLLKREPQLIEGPKRCLFLQGRRSSETIRNLLSDLYDLKKPDAHKLTKKNDMTLFEDTSLLEKFGLKYETPLFMFGSHSKKRPNNLITGRLYNCSLLDMVEFHVENFKSMREYSGSKVMLQTKPCLIFNGALWEEDTQLKHIKSLFIDIFHREEVESIRLQGIEHCLSFTAKDDGRINVRSYKILMKRSLESKVPTVELQEIGPRIDLAVRRSKLPSADLMKESMKQPKELRTKKKKNIHTDALGTTHGRVHVGKQNILKIQTRKMKGLKKTAAERKAQRERMRQALREKNTSSTSNGTS